MMKRVDCFVIGRKSSRGTTRRLRELGVASESRKTLVVSDPLERECPDPATLPRRARCCGGVTLLFNVPFVVQKCLDRTKHKMESVYIEASYRPAFWKKHIDNVKIGG